jgi:SAM-dependent methyltransferase
MSMWPMTARHGREPTMTDTTFDPVAYKETTRAQWDAAAAAWDRWNPTLDAWLADATARMLDLAGVGPGDAVIDIAAGSGGQTVDAARRAGPTGSVLATDLSGGILAYVGGRAAAAGIDTVTTAAMDGENLTVAPASYEVAISRLGVIYFPDRARALAGIHRVLKPGGRIGLIVYGPADRNGFFSVPVGIIRAAARIPAPAPGQPGPFSLAADGVLADELGAAGFTDIVVEAVDAPIRLPDASTCLRFERESFGALHQMLAGFAEPDRERVWSDVHDALRAFEGDDGFVAPCQLLVAVGTA